MVNNRNPFVKMSEILETGMILDAVRVYGAHHVEQRIREDE